MLKVLVSLGLALLVGGVTALSYLSTQLGGIPGVEAAVGTCLLAFVIAVVLRMCDSDPRYTYFAFVLSGALFFTLLFSHVVASYQELFESINPLYVALYVGVIGALPSTIIPFAKPRSS